MEATRHLGAVVRPPTRETPGPLGVSVAEREHAQASSGTPAPSPERRVEQRMESLNYAALGACLIVVNGWFVLSVLQFG